MTFDNSSFVSNQNAANVACKHMGHISGTYVDKEDTPDGTAHTQAWNVVCDGTEASLNDCSKTCCDYTEAN